MKKHILISLLILACLLITPAFAWPASEDMGDIDVGQYVDVLTTADNGDYTEIDGLCAQYNPTRPYGLAEGFFATAYYETLPFDASYQSPDGGIAQIYPPPKNFTLANNWQFGGWPYMRSQHYSFFYYTIYCSATTRTTNPTATGFVYKYWHLTGDTYVPPVPVAGFTCTPTSQYPDTSVVCTDTSTNTPTDWYWTIDAEAMGVDAWQTSTTRNYTWESHYPGLYSVNLRANNSAGSSWENKTNYVSISVNATPNNCNLPVASGYIRTYAQTNDGMTSGGIYGSQIQMRDMEGGAWSNTTSSEGYWCIDTLPGHSLNLYAQATGYTSTSQLGVSANGGRYYLVLWPDYIPAPSSGNVSLYVLVYDQQTGTPLYLSSVRVDGNNINTILKNTGPEGQAVFTIKNQTSIHVTASKAGYNTITRTMTTSNTGPDTLMISLPRSTVTVAPTQTTGPGGTVPTTIGPYGTPGPGGTMAPGYTNNQGQLMMDFLARNGLSLVELCFFVTVLALLGVKLGK
jgi:PKD repeat protein